jgi:hypothetical protein
MTEVMPTSSTVLEIGSLGNLQEAHIDFISPVFVYKAHHFVYRDDQRGFLYFSLGKCKVDDSSLFFNLPSRPPVLRDGVLILPGKVLIKISRDDIIRGRACKSRMLTSSEQRIFINGTDDTVSESEGEAVQPEDNQGTIQDFGDEERTDADLALEEQIEALFYASNPQALGRIQDLTRTRQVAKRRPIPDLE